MEQDVRFCELDGRRIAYAGVGEGPLLLFGGRWVSTSRRSGTTPMPGRSTRASPGRIGSSATTGSGAGLSDRALERPPTPETEAAQLAAVLDACTDGAATLFACSCAGLATARFATEAPERVHKIVFFGGYASRDDIPDATRRSLVDFARVNWMLAAQMLAGLFVPRGGGEEIEALSRYQRTRRTPKSRRRSSSSTSRPMRGRSSRLGGAVARPPPAGRPHGADRPRTRARLAAAELALRRARGDSHLPWKDDQRDLQRALAGFLDDAAP